MRYAVLLSGGVDSSTALAELASAGHRVTAHYLKVWLEDELDYLGDCPWEEDLEYARAVCTQFGVPLNVVPLQLEYYDRVVEYTLSELRAGRTPSPDIFCNQRIKFGAFLDHLAADSSDAATRIATGHYARIVDRGDHVELARSPDPVKDQTYFLSHLSQEQLRRIEFPIGGFEKDEVRRRAHEWKLPNRDRKDSQGICFLGKIRYPEFIRHYLGERPGPIIEMETGDRLGEHRGFWFHTIGQRTGLGLAGGPWYVVKKDVDRNAILVSHSNAANDRARSDFTVRELTWTWKAPEKDRLLLKIRHGPQLIGATISRLGDGALAVSMDGPDRGVAPGQFAVFYDGETCLGSGKIQEE